MRGSKSAHRAVTVSGAFGLVAGAASGAASRPIAAKNLCAVVPSVICR